MLVCCLLVYCEVRGKIRQMEILLMLMLLAEILCEHIPVYLRHVLIRESVQDHSSAKARSSTKGNLSATATTCREPCQLPISQLLLSFSQLAQPPDRWGSSGNQKREHGPAARPESFGFRGSLCGCHFSASCLCWLATGTENGCENMARGVIMADGDSFRSVMWQVGPCVNPPL